MTIRVGINGFGRIGRGVLRAFLKMQESTNLPIEIAAINDLGDLGTCAHLLKYDSVHGKLKQPVEVLSQGNSLPSLKVGGYEIAVTSHRQPAEIPWGKLGISLVLECTGFFTDKTLAEGHMRGGAKKVLISAPAKNPDLTVAFGVNHTSYNPEIHHIISNASCTTNCLAPLAMVLHSEFGIIRGLMNTIHSYTNDQRILDVSHEDLRRSRAAAMSQIPTKTGAAAAVGLVLPELNGKIDGMAIRVPTPNVSCVDFVCNVNKSTSASEVNLALQKAAEGSLKGVLGCSNEPLVSIDFNGDTRSSIVDTLSTKVIDNSMLRVLSWYDNETGFSNRMIDVATHMSQYL